MNKKLPLLLVFAMLSANGLGAETKKLTCDSPVSGYQTKKDLIRMEQAACEKGRVTGCDLVRKYTRELEECIASGKPFEQRITFTFETAALDGKSNSFAEQENIPCHNSNQRYLLKVPIESTPNKVIFKQPYRIEEVSEFTVNRETLMGFYGNKNWSCSIEVLPRDKNKF